MNKEIWRPVVGYPELGHVEVSNLGRVRTLDRLAPSSGGGPPQLRRGTVLSPWLQTTGYPCVAIKVGPRRRKYLVHRLVGLAFVPGHFDGATIDHIDGCKTNNRSDNLRWVTVARNTQLQWETGLVNLRGERHPSAKLTDEHVRAIPTLLQAGFRKAAVARMFGVSPSLVGKIANGSKRRAAFG